MKSSTRLLLGLSLAATAVYFLYQQFSDSEEVDESKDFDPAKAAELFGKKVKKNDLKVVEGIGPKIEELFHAAGIKTWKQLAESSVSKLQKILDAGENFTLHNPATWPKQASLAFKGKWETLKNWQEELNAGT